FGAVIALFAQGVSSPFYVFFAFAVIAAGARGGFRFGMGVTSVSIWVYLSLILVSTTGPTQLHTYIMGPAYLAIVGYLVAYLGRVRLNLESKLAALERAKERNEIARALHDGCVQTLAGTNLTLGSCQELVRRGRAGEALAALGELQASITREYDGLRTYIRELADHETAPPSFEFDTRFAVNAQFGGSGPLVEHVLQILLDGVRNVRRHALRHPAARPADGAQRLGRHQGPRRARHRDRGHRQRARRGRPRRPPLGRARRRLQALRDRDADGRHRRGGRGQRMDAPRAPEAPDGAPDRAPRGAAHPARDRDRAPGRHGAAQRRGGRSPLDQRGDGE